MITILVVVCSISRSHHDVSVQFLYCFFISWKKKKTERRRNESFSSYPTDSSLPLPSLSHRSSGTTVSSWRSPTNTDWDIFLTEESVSSISGNSSSDSLCIWSYFHCYQHLWQHMFLQNCFHTIERPRYKRDVGDVVFGLRKLVTSHSVSFLSNVTNVIQCVTNVSSEEVSSAYFLLVFNFYSRFIQL